jgi:uncharacterized protein (UPF0261 family)
MKKVVAMIGTLDTKSTEYKFLKDHIEAKGVSTLVIDAGVLGKPAFPPDISSSEVARVGGVDLKDLIEEGDRGHAMAVMGQGVAAIIKDLHQSGRIHGVIAMGGGGATSIATAAMRTLPIGVPKLVVSTRQPIVDVQDITMMPSIVDISGINRILAKIIRNAAAAIAGMVKAEVEVEEQGKPLIAATMAGVTTPCVTKAREILERAGYEVLVFHSSGDGGRAMEELVRSGFIVGVLDITTTELADELGGGMYSAGPRRLEAAGEVGIPQVVSAGALDMIKFGPPETVPAKFKGRRFNQHNPIVTLIRTTQEENEELGKMIGEKLNRARGPTTFLMPKKGVSLIDTEGQPFYDPQADAAFLDSLRANLSSRVRLVEMDTDINDEQFAVTATEILLRNLKG